MEKTTEFEGGIIALSSFGFGGSNVHFLLHGAARQRQVLPLADSSNSDNSSAAEFQSDNIIPLAARTPEGLADLAKAIGDVRTLLCALLLALTIQFSKSAARLSWAFR